MPYSYCTTTTLPKSVVNQPFEMERYPVPHLEEGADTHPGLWCRLWDARVAEVLKEITRELDHLFKTNTEAVLVGTEQKYEKRRGGTLYHLHQIRGLTQYQADLFFSCHLVHGLCSVFKASGHLLQEVTLHAEDVIRDRGKFSSTTFCRPVWKETTDTKELSRQKRAFQDHMQAIRARLGTSRDEWSFLRDIMCHGDKRRDMSEVTSLSPHARSMASWFGTMALFPQNFGVLWEQTLLDSTLSQEPRGKTRPRL